VRGLLGEFFIVTQYVYLHVQIFDVVYSGSSCGVADLLVLLGTRILCIYTVLDQVVWGGGMVPHLLVLLGTRGLCVYTVSDQVVWVWMVSWPIILTKMFCW
jgi:hypothetical protein